MRRLLLLSMLCVTAGAISGCSLDEVHPTENIPYAGVRFINAVPDTAGAFGMDLRFVDQPENNAHFRIGFRSGPTTSGGVTASTGVQFKATRAGSRQFRIFLNDSLQAVASVVLKDTIVTLEAGRNYTALLLGNARTTAPPAMRLVFFEETVADPGAQVALRVINTTPTAIDVRHYPDAGAVPAAATWANVASLSVSAHVLATPGRIRYNVRPAGGGANLFADALALIGVAASSTAGTGAPLDIEATPGTTVAGSAITLIVWPRSTAGARTPQTAAFQVPAASSIWDRRPPYIQ